MNVRIRSDKSSFDGLVGTVMRRRGTSGDYLCTEIKFPDSDHVKTVWFSEWEMVQP